jgi:hypothetical protein
MGIRSIQFMALAVLSLAAGAVAIQTAPSDAANVCVFSTDAGNGVELASLFTSDTQVAEGGAFANAPLFIYAANDAVFEAEGIAFVDVKNVTSCAHHGDVI